MKLGSGAHSGTAMNRTNRLLQLPSFSNVLMFLREVNGRMAISYTHTYKNAAISPKKGFANTKHMTHIHS